MSQIKWENVPDAEVRADVESVLESSGEGKKIRTYMNTAAEIESWREEIRRLSRQLINEIGIDNLTPDILYDHIACRARELMPQSVVDEVTNRLVTFLQSQFEDHI